MAELRLRATVERYDIIEATGGDDSTIGRSWDVIRARLSLVHAGQHVDYTIRVFHEGKTWTLKKRFNELSAMHDVIKKRFTTVPELPSKSVVRQFSPDYLEARKVGITAYLQELCKRPDVLSCPEVQQFFSIPGTSFRGHRTSDPHAAMEAQIGSACSADPAAGPLQSRPPLVAGAQPGAATRANDSDDDLAGWDR
mmetsp:Transcript_29306/g.93488  ORF Transcript_29306/g.93488 Transcript_29306/m.93488 type:complete len:196 (-) Transcript_29306:130-717(-)